ncbi:MAG TPA: GYF domain-containing protein [Candidatus Paceibacterota bacterium]|nr:GYF domain-containing protein [Verrucomicrobiota bacterium]HSA11417.1 GYF domain-containing protein [Candidatus Paceibacterota bacterium]
MYKIIGADQKEYGPVSAEQLRQWMAEGRVTAQTQVLPEGGTEWKALGDLPEFATAASRPVPGISVEPTPGPNAADRVKGPATGLIVTAVLGVIAQIFSLVWHFAGASMMPSDRIPKEAWANMFSGTIGVVSSIIAILLSGLIFFGAMKMKKLESYGLAMTASIIAMIPCLSPCCLIGLPIGIWAVMVLSKEEVKSAFH